MRRSLHLPLVRAGGGGLHAPTTLSSTRGLGSCAKASSAEATAGRLARPSSSCSTILYPKWAAISRRTAPARVGACRWHVRRGYASDLPSLGEFAAAAEETLHELQDLLEDAGLDEEYDISYAVRRRPPFQINKNTGYCVNLFMKKKNRKEIIWPDCVRPGWRADGQAR